ncbi:FaeA-like protein, partial [Halogranum rubrum]
MSDPSSIDFAAEWEAELDGRTTVEKIYDVALQLAEPLRVADIADRAGVAPDTARKYLGFLTETGVVKKASDDPATYRRNDDYLEWRQVDRLRTEHT